MFLQLIYSTQLYFIQHFHYPYRLTWKPLNPSIEQMEFRIFHNIFCSTFKIRKGAFAFDEYVTKVFQKSVLELIEISLIDWLYVTILLFLNMARVKLNIHTKYCDRHDQDCDTHRTVRLFTIVGNYSICKAFYRPFIL